jgi:8-oxo-dGTP pyrophosphatase MutT (NUDIX family)
MIEERSAGFVIFRRHAGKRHYLLLEHNDGHWDFPKGNIERGETSKVAAVRELKEETGIKWVRQIAGWDRDIEYFYTREGKRVHKVVTFYLGEAPDERVTISHEHKGSGWFSFEDAMAKVKFENARSTIASAEKFLYMNPGK